MVWEVSVERESSRNMNKYRGVIVLKGGPLNIQTGKQTDMFS